MKKHIAEELPARKFKQAAMDASNKEGGKKEGKSPEERVRQAVYDIRYRARREEIPLAQAFAQYMQNSNMSAPEKALVKAKLEGKEMKEEYGISELASDSIANALYKVFVETNNYNETDEDELVSFYREEVIKNSRGETKYKVEVMGTDGRSYIRYATREKINDLRANPNIKSVEMTDYGEPYEGEKKRGEQTAAAKAGKDYDGDGKVESGSKEHAGVVHNAIQRKKGGVPDGQDTRKESVEFIDEVRDVKKKKKKKGDKSDKNAKIDVMDGTNTVKVGPTDGQSIMAGYEYSSPVLTENDATLGQVKFSRMLQEKAVSQNQQQLAGMALAYLRGEMPNASEEVKKMAKMGEKKLRDFAKTKHKGLPEKVEEAKCETSDKEDEDTRGEYAKNNVIKNRIRAALGVKNPIVISASNEMEGEQIDEFLNFLNPFKKTSDTMKNVRKKTLSGEPTTTKPKSIQSNFAKIRAAQSELMNQSYEPEGELVDEATAAAKRGLPDTHRPGKERRKSAATASLAAVERGEERKVEVAKKYNIPVPTQDTVEKKAHKKNFPGSRQKRKERGAKDPAAENRAGVEANNARVKKYGLTKKQKATTDAIRAAGRLGT